MKGIIPTIVTVFTLGAVFFGSSAYNNAVDEKTVAIEQNISEQYTELNYRISKISSRVQDTFGIADYGSDQLREAISGSLTGKFDDEEFLSVLKKKYPTIDSDKMSKLVSNESASFSAEYNDFLNSLNHYEHWTKSNPVRKYFIDDVTGRNFQIAYGRGNLSGENASIRIFDFGRQRG